VYVIADQLVSDLERLVGNPNEPPTPTPAPPTNTPVPLPTAPEGTATPAA